MTTHLQDIILDQVNVNMQLFENTQRIEVVGYTTGQGRSTLATLSAFKLIFSLF